MTNATVHNSPLMPVVARPELVMVRGEGSYLWDEHGRRYLDFIQGWAVNALGHCAEEVRAALALQSAKLFTPSPAFHNAPQLALAQKLVELSGLHQIHFCNSGAEANELAIKVARKWGRTQRGGAFEIITTAAAFHGRTLAAMAASGKPGWDDLFPPNMPGFRRVPFGSAAAVRDAIGDLTVAILVEPIQGEAGAVVPKSGYLRELRELADERGLLLMLDEVQTGMGRTGTLFAFEREDIVPDVLTLGKGLGSGVPISAVLTSPKASCLGVGDQGGTYNGNPLMAAVGLAVLETVATPEFLAAVRARGEELSLGLQALGLDCGAAARGRGLLQALVLADDRAERIRDSCFELGLIVNAARPNVLRFMPSLRVSSSEIAEMLAILGRALRA